MKRKSNDKYFFRKNKNTDRLQIQGSNNSRKINFRL